MPPLTSRRTSRTRLSTTWSRPAPSQRGPGANVSAEQMSTMGLVDVREGQTKLELNLAVSLTTPCLFHFQSVLPFCPAKTQPLRPRALTREAVGVIFPGIRQCLTLCGFKGELLQTFNANRLQFALNSGRLLSSRARSETAVSRLAIKINLYSRLAARNLH